MQSKFALVIDYSVSCVAAALEAYDYVIILSQKVDHTAFSFISPVDAYYCAITHFISFSLLHVFFETLHDLVVCFFYSAEVSSESVFVEFLLGLAVPESACIRADLICKDDSTV